MPVAIPGRPDWSCPGYWLEKTRAPLALTYILRIARRKGCAPVYIAHAASFSPPSFADSAGLPQSLSNRSARSTTLPRAKQTFIILRTCRLSRRACVNVPPWGCGEIPASPQTDVLYRAAASSRKLRPEKNGGSAPLKVLVDQDLNRLKVPVWEVLETLLARSDGLVGGLEVLDRLDEVVVILL